MKLQELTVIIAQQDPIRANAVGKMAEYITQRFRPAFLSKEQAQAVNAYLDRICPPSNYPITETECEHRRIAAQQLVIDSIQVLNHDELDKLSDVLDHIEAVSLQAAVHVVQLDARDAARGGVVELRGEILRQGIVLSLLLPAGHEVVTLFRNHPVHGGHFVRGVLQVGVHGEDDLALRALEAAVKRGGFAVIAAET